jgi:PAS domain S-box-containing protein
MLRERSAPDGGVSVEAAAVIERLPIGVFAARIAADGAIHVASLNAEAARIFGEQTHEWTPVGDPEVIEGSALEELAGIARAVHDHPEPAAWVGDIGTPSGPRTIEVSTTPTGRVGDELLIHGFVQDITDRRAEERATARLLADLAETQAIGGIGSWTFRLIGGNAWSDEMLRIHGLAPGTPIPDDPDWYARFVAPDTFARLTGELARVLHEGGAYELAYEVHGADGHTRHVLSRGSALVGDDGSTAGVRGTTIDVTDLVATRDTLARREAELAEAQHLAQVGSWVLEADGRLTWSDECFRIHGLDPATDEPVLDRYFELFGPEAGQERLRGLIARGLSAGEPYVTECSIRRPDGTVRHLLARGSPVRGDDGAIRGLRGSVVDITELVQAREALAASERLHGTVVDALAEGVVVQDREGAIIAANPAAERILGIRRDEITGLSSMDPRWQASHEDGTPCPGEEHPAMIALRTGRPFEGAVMQISHPERARVWLRINASPLLDEAGMVAAVVVSFEDITRARAAHEAERRFNEELERRVTERTAALAAANEELRVFSATVSHDLRAPVRAVAGFARLLQKRYADELPEEAAHYVDNLVVAGETMGRLIDDFLAYARFGADGLNLQPVELAPIVDWLRSTLVERIAETDATLRAEEPLATPVGDPALLRRMLLNLVDNALTYARPGVPPEIAIAAMMVEDRVEISVADNGRGIEPAALERIFEVFARVEPGQDLAHAGIGLAMVRKAARAMDSDVTVESSPGTGTVFRFSLPAAPIGDTSDRFSILPVDNPSRVG